MKKSFLIAFLLVLASVPCFSQPQDAESLDLAALLNPQAANGSCPQPQNAASFLSPTQNALCIADCGLHGSLTCQWTTSCSAVDRECPRRGSVTCNGTTYLCPVCTTADYCYQCEQDSNDCVSCCVCAGDTVAFCRDACR